MGRVILGVDPAINANGWALQSESGTRFGSFEDIGTLAKELDSILEGIDTSYRLVCVIECPTWSGVGTRETRSAAIQWERELQRRFADRSIVMVDPRNWQSMLLKGVPGETTKDRSLRRVEWSGFDVKSDHEADAINLMEYAAMIADGMVSETERKSSTKRRRAS